MTGHDFVALRKEKIVMVKKPEKLEWIKELKRLLSSSDFKVKLSRIGWYGYASTGKVIWESGRMYLL